MYTAFYELKQEPFHVTPDPEFLFPSPAHKEALAAIIYGIEQRKGFVAITGEVGVGKTTILRSYLEFADRRNLKLIYIYNSALTFDELITTVLQELGVTERPPSTFLAVTRLHEELIEIYRKNETVVLIIDEAQNIPVETLESLRMLSNLETVTEKLIQIMLIGQPEFDDLLQQHRLRQLKQRIAIHARINPLNTEDSVAYLEHRLAKVSIGTKPVFTKNALRLIASSSQGIPRNLNILSDNALITGFGYKIRPVNTRIVKEVLADRGVAQSREPRIRRSVWIGGGAAAVAAGTALTALWLHFDLVPVSEFSIAQLPAVVDRGTSPAHPPERTIASAGDRASLARLENRGQSGNLGAIELPRFPSNMESRGALPSPLKAAPEQEPSHPTDSMIAASNSAPNAAPAPSRTEELLRPLVIAPPAPPPLEPPRQASSGATDAHPPSSSAITGARDAQPIQLKSPSRAAAASRPAPVPAATPAPKQAPPALAMAVPSVMMPSASGSGITAAGPSPATSNAASRRPTHSEQLVRTVRAGDSLWTMTEDVYGFVNPSVLRRVQDANPHIRDINFLAPGQEVVFPRVAEMPAERGSPSLFNSMPETGRN